MNGFQIVKSNDLIIELEKYLRNYNYSPNTISNSIAILKSYIGNFRANLSVGIEFPYVDKLYRDCYYHYYSSKLKAYERDCIRLSFFSKEISLNDFYSEQAVKDLQNNFLGFIVLRPTAPRMIGRNILRPNIFNKRLAYNLIITHGKAAVNGVKLTVEGFPHASQDGEMMVCAETTVWSILEYFSSKYPDYRSLLPSEINKILSSTSMQRQLPSKGLSALQVSFALKELGFGTRILSEGAETYKKEELFKIIQMYVESGIPVVAAVGNTEVKHVMNIVGRTEFKPLRANKIVAALKLKSGAEIYDYYDQDAEYLVIDDNLPPYSEIHLDDPGCNYVRLNDDRWKGCKIFGAIVPLHRKIYMEINKAQQAAFEVLKAIDGEETLPSLFLRTFLTSSRSYKHYITQSNLDMTVKTVLVNIDMPKFVYVAELSTTDLLAKTEACGLILIDATEPKSSSILGYLWDNKFKGYVNNTYNTYNVSLQPFKIFNNLKQF